MKMWMTWNNPDQSYFCYDVWSPCVLILASGWKYWVDDHRDHWNIVICKHRLLEYNPLQLYLYSVTPTHMPVLSECRQQPAQTGFDQNSHTTLYSSSSYSPTLLIPALRTDMCGECSSEQVYSGFVASGQINRSIIWYNFLKNWHEK